MHEVSHVGKAPSELYARLLIRYDKPPLYDEEYRMQDVEGVSSFTYRVRGYNGRQITVTAPPAAVYDVSFFFQRLDQIGVWQIVDKPPLKMPTRTTRSTSNSWPTTSRAKER